MPHVGTFHFSGECYSEYWFLNSGTPKMGTKSIAVGHFTQNHFQKCVVS